MQKVVKEAEILRGDKQDIAAQSISNSFDLKPTSKTNELALSFDLSKTTAQDFGLVLSNSKGEKVLIGYEKSTNRFYVDRTEGGKKNFEKGFSGRHYAPRLAESNMLKMNIHIDVASVELFADDGATVMTDVFFPNEDFNQIAIFSKEGMAYLEQGTLWRIKSAW